MAGETPPKPPDPPDKKPNEKKTDHFYKETDNPPYEVYIQSKNNNIGNYHLLSIAKEIFSLNLTDVVSTNKKGKNRIGVICKTPQAANKLVKNKELKEKGYDIFIPAHHVSCKGIVRYVDKNISDEELMNFSKANLSNVNILNVRRFNRKETIDNEVKYIPTGTILYTFSGRIIPGEISIYNLPMKVVPYVGPVIQCQNCFLFGHTSNLCRSKKKCPNCGGTHEVGSPCKTKCIHCKSDKHKSSNKEECPEFTRQKNIKETMSFANKSYYEASLLVPKTKKEEIPELNSENFPALGKYENDNSIQVDQRRSRALMEPSNNSSYRNIVQNSKKRKHNTNIGYNKEEYNKWLNNPNGRNQDLPSQSFYVNRNQKEDNINQDFSNTLKLLSESQKELIFNYIRELLRENGSIDRNPYYSHSNLTPNTQKNMDWSEDSDLY